MRKRFVEKLSYYKLLDDLNGLPDECSLTPIFIDKCDGNKLVYIDFYVTFTRHFLDMSEAPDARFTLLFMYKSKNIRISSMARFAFQCDLRDEELTQFCFNSQILTVADFFQACLGEVPDYKSALEKVQLSDNEHFGLIQSF